MAYLFYDLIQISTLLLLVVKIIQSMVLYEKLKLFNFEYHESGYAIGLIVVDIRIAITIGQFTMEAIS